MVYSHFSEEQFTLSVIKIFLAKIIKKYYNKTKNKEGISKNEKKVIGIALMCALTMLQVTDVSAAEIAKGDVITIESIKTSTDKVASNYSTNSDMLLSRIVQEGMVPTSKRSNVIHEDDLVITETEITYQQLFPTSLTSSMVSAQAKAAGYKTGFSFHIYMRCHHLKGKNY